MIHILGASRFQNVESASDVRVMSRPGCFDRTRHAAYRGKVNNPSYVPFVARQLAELRGVRVTPVYTLNVRP